VEQDGQWKLLHREHVTVKHGAFAATLVTSGPGAYGLTVDTPADAVSAAGMSAPVPITVP
jgi:hypothetical protein